MILATAGAVIHRKVLHRLHKEMNSSYLLQIGLQAVNHVGCADVALRDRLQVDLNASTVQSRIGAVDSNERRQAGHGWVLQNDEGYGFRSLREALNDADILNRKQAFWNNDIKVDREP